jgi:hypothetical protein
MQLMRTVLMLLVVFAPLTVELSAQSTVDELSWMSGCWRQESAGRVVDEMWMTPGGGALFGIGRTVARGRVVSYEFMRIHDDGGLTFTSKPSGQAEASFKVLKRGAREIVFENLAHDFPQRVMYRLDGDTLIGRIEGTEKGKPGSAEFPMRRIECPK